jgi:hypothetical protein
MAASMSQNFTYVIVALGFYILAVIIPLIPAVIIYRIFPDTAVTASGPLSGLTVKASGAFAAYVIVFLLTALMWNKSFGSIGSLASESWTVQGTLEVKDGSGQKLIDQNHALQHVRISFDPDFTRARGNHFRLKLPDIDGQIPSLTFSIEDGGGSSDAVDFSSPGAYKIQTDPTHNLKTVTVPVVITLSGAPHPYRYDTPAQPRPPSQNQPLLQAHHG